MCGERHDMDTVWRAAPCYSRGWRDSWDMAHPGRPRARLTEELRSTMFESGRCPGGNHVPPKTGGSCPCGMVTRLPTPAPESPTELLALLAQCLDDGNEALDAATA